MSLLDSYSRPILRGSSSWVTRWIFVLDDWANCSENVLPTRACELPSSQRITKHDFKRSHSSVVTCVNSRESCKVFQIRIWNTCDVFCIWSEFKMYFVFKYKKTVFTYFKYISINSNTCVRFSWHLYSYLGFWVQLSMFVEVYLLLKSSCHISQWETNCRTTCLKHFCCSKPMRTLTVYCNF